MPEDRFGLPLTTVSDAAARDYVEGVDRLLAAWPGADRCLARALEADADFALAHAAEARLLQMQGRTPDARAAAARARACAAACTARERRHVEAVALVVDGMPAKSLALVTAHLEAHPRDALVLSLALGAFGLITFSGRPDHDAARLALCERLAPEYGDDWWFLTFHGWAHTEIGNLEVGSRLTGRALELRRENGHGAHALAHAFYEQGDVDGGLAFLEGWMPGYEPAGQLHGHLSWHHALLELACGRVDGALGLYASAIRPGVSMAPPINVATDGPSLMWRIALETDVPPALPWRELDEYVAGAFPSGAPHFVEVHAAMAAAGAGDSAALARRVADLQARLDAGTLPAGEVVPALGLALDAFARADYPAAIDRLDPVLPEVIRIGGSHAQREVYEDTLIVACLRAGRPARARALLEQRLARRPSARDAAWLAQAASGLNPGN